MPEKPFQSEKTAKVPKFPRKRRSTSVQIGLIVGMKRGLAAPPRARRRRGIQGARRVGQARDIVQRYIIKLCQMNHQFKGRLPFALLIVGVGGLVHPQSLHQLRLGQIVALPQVAQARIAAQMIPSPFLSAVVISQMPLCGGQFSCYGSLYHSQSKMSYSFLSYKILPHNTAKQHIVSTKYRYHVSLEIDGRERKPGSCLCCTFCQAAAIAAAGWQIAINFLQRFCRARQRIFYSNAPSTCKLLDTTAGGRYNE